MSSRRPGPRLDGRRRAASGLRGRRAPRGASAPGRARLVDQPPRRHPDQPRPRVRRARPRPATAAPRQQRLLHRVLGGAEVAVAAHQRGQDVRRLAAPARPRGRPVTGRGRRAHHRPELDASAGPGELGDDLLGPLPGLDVDQEEPGQVLLRLGVGPVGPRAGPVAPPVERGRGRVAERLAADQLPVGLHLAEERLEVRFISRCRTSSGRPWHSGRKSGVGCPHGSGWSGSGSRTSSFLRCWCRGAERRCAALSMPRRSQGSASVSADRRTVKPRRIVVGLVDLFAVPGHGQGTSVVRGAGDAVDAGQGAGVTLPDPPVACRWGGPDAAYPEPAVQGVTDGEAGLEVGVGVDDDPLAGARAPRRRGRRAPHAAGRRAPGGSAQLPISSRSTAGGIDAAGPEARTSLKCSPWGAPGGAEAEVVVAADPQVTQLRRACGGGRTGGR